MNKTYFQINIKINHKNSSNRHKNSLNEVDNSSNEVKIKKIK